MTKIKLGPLGAGARAGSRALLAAMVFAAGWLSVRAQDADMDYTFAQSSGTYTPITGGTVHASETFNDVVFQNIDIGFPFVFNRQTHTKVSVSDNGFIAFPSVSWYPVGIHPLTTNYTPLSSTANPTGYFGAVAGFGTNLASAASGTPEIRVQTIGTAPNRTFVVQYQDVRFNGDAGMRMSFQIRLNENGNTVEIVYGGTITQATTNRTGQIGLRGANQQQFNNQTGTNWTTLTAGTLNSSTVTFGTTGGTTIPADGLTFTWTPPAPLSTPTYATLPATENFDGAWMQYGSSVTNDVPSANWAAWPNWGNNSWRRNDATTGTSGWVSTSGGFTVSAPASGNAARFHSIDARLGQIGYLDYYLNCAAGGTGVNQVSFDYINTSGADTLRFFVSTDGGATFTAITSAAYAIQAAWTNRTFNFLSSSATTVLRMVGRSDLSASDIGVDNLQVTALPACTGTPNAGTIVPSLTSACVGGTVSFTFSGLTVAGNMQYRIEVSDDDLTYTALTDYNINPNLVNGYTHTPSSLGTKYYRVQSVCTASGETNKSPGVAVTADFCTYDYDYLVGTEYQAITGTAFSGWLNGTSTDDNRTFVEDLTGVGFDFKFRGQAVTSFQVCTNGWVKFNGDAGVNSFVNDMASTGQPLNMLACFWEDWIASPHNSTLATLNANIRWEISGTAPGRILTIQFANMSRLGQEASCNLNWQVKLYETTNVIEYVFGSMQGYKGIANFALSYSIGHRGPSVTPLTVDNMVNLRVERSKEFSSVAQNALAEVPLCYSTWRFTPGAHTFYPAPASVTSPPNDESAGAIALNIEGQLCDGYCGRYYRNRNATASPQAVCAGTADDDVWFKVTTGAIARDFNVVVGGGNGVQPRIQIFDTDQTTPLSITGASGNCVAASGSGLTATVNVLAADVSPNTTYYIRVYHTGAGSGTAQSFFICPHYLAGGPDNDECEGALAAPITTSCAYFPTTGSTAGASASAEAVCAGTADDDVWYKFVAPSTSVTVTLQGQVGFDPVLEIWDGGMAGDCGTKTAVSGSCTDNTGTASSEVYTLSATPGHTYYIRVYHAGAGAGTGNFVLSVVDDFAVSVSANAGADLSVCTGSVTALSGSASAGAGGYTYIWSPATNLSATNVPNPDFTAPLSTGTYTYILTVTDADGCVAEDIVAITVQAPSVNAGADKTICEGSSTPLNATVSGVSGGVTYSWAPAAGLSATNVANPVASPTTTTTYTVTVTHACGTATDEITVTVGPSSTLDADAGTDVSIDLGDDTVLNGGATGGTPGYFYSWSPSGSLNNAFIAAPTATPSVTTDYTLTVTDSEGCTDVDVVRVTVNVGGGETITTDDVSATEFCPGASVDVGFTASGTFGGGNVFTAQLSDETGSFAMPTAIGTLAGTGSGTISATIPGGATAGTGYRIRVVSSDPAVDGTDNGADLTVHANPAVPSITPASPVNFCDGGVLTSSAAMGNQWIKDGMDLTGETGTTLNVTTSGDYQVRVTISGCSSTSAVTAVTVNASPTVSIDAVVHPSCGGCTDGYIHASGGATHRLDMGTPQVSGEFNDLGTGSYDVTAISAAGCEDTDDIDLVVCEKKTIIAVGNLLATSARPRWTKAEFKPGYPNGRFMLQWRLAPAGMWNTVADIADTAYTIAGLTPSTTYHVRIAYACGDEGWSNWSDVAGMAVFTTQSAVCPIPTAVMTSPAGSGNRNVTWTGDASAVSYNAACGLTTVTPSSWPTITVMHPTTTTTFTGLNPTKQYRARAQANCSAPLNPTSNWSTTSATFVPNSREAQTLSSEGLLVVYPNPNRGTFTVRLSSTSDQTAELRLTDVLGRTVWQSKTSVVAGVNDVEVALKAASGVYALTVHRDGDVRTVKVTVE